MPCWTFSASIVPATSRVTTWSPCVLSDPPAVSCPMRPAARTLTAMALSWVCWPRTRLVPWLPKVVTLSVMSSRGSSLLTWIPTAPPAYVVMLWKRALVRVPS